MADGSFKTEPSVALHVYNDAIALLDDAYEQAAGEVTDEVGALEQLTAMVREQALEAFAKYIRGCDHAEAAVKAEAERLKVAKTRIEKRRAWAERELVALLERDGQTKATAGSFRITTRAGSKAVQVAADLQLEALPPDLVRWSDPKPAEAFVDKHAAKEYLSNASNPPIPGLVLVTNPRSVKID